MLIQAMQRLHAIRGLIRVFLVPRTLLLPPKSIKLARIVDIHPLRMLSTENPEEKHSEFI